jgi:acetyl esterase/lipase
MIDDDDPMSTLTVAMRRVLDAQLALGWKPAGTLPVAQLRQRPTLADAAAAVLAKQGRTAPDRGVRIEDLQASSGPAPLRIRLYRPRQAAARLPLILYFHGGIWVDGSPEEYDTSAAALADRSGAILASPDYRLAPEHPYPAAHEDALAAHDWLLAEGARLGGDPKRIGVVGEAAGGMLAANVVIRARDSVTRTPSALAMISPVIGTDTASWSYNRTENCRPLDKAAMRWSLHQAIDAKHWEDRRLNLGDFNLQGLPATTIVTADVDPLMFEGKLFAHKLESSGVPVRYRNVEGVTHGFFGLDAVLPEAADAQDFVATALRDAFGS